MDSEKLENYWGDHKYYIFAVVAAIILIAVAVFAADGFVETGITG